MSLMKPDRRRYLGECSSRPAGGTCTSRISTGVRRSEGQVENCTGPSIEAHDQEGARYGGRG